MSARTSTTCSIVRGLALALMALSALGCSVSSPAPPSPSGPTAGPTIPATPQGPDVSAADTENLRERAAAFWAARIALDPTKQWELLEPRGRGRMAAAEYGGVQRAVKYLAYQVEDANVRGYFGTVKVRLIVQPVLPSAPQRRIAPAAVVVEDAWVKVRGVWYRALEQEEGRRPAETQQ